MFRTVVCKFKCCMDVLTCAYGCVFLGGALDSVWLCIIFIVFTPESRASLPGFRVKLDGWDVDGLGGQEGGRKKAGRRQAEGRQKADTRQEEGHVLPILATSVTGMAYKGRSGHAARALPS